jgi:hypothetical protein
MQAPRVLRVPEAMELPLSVTYNNLNRHATVALRDDRGFSVYKRQLEDQGY